jgi:hypothetical protein
MSGGDEMDSILKCLLSHTRGHLQLCPVILDTKCCRFSRIRLQWHLPGTGEPLGVVARGLGVCPVRA